jgi:F0F1-type ATP synthase membrane subunit b/b'
MEAARHLTPVPDEELPRLEELPRGDGYAADAVERAFDSYRRHTARLTASLRVLQAAQGTADPSGHGSRLDSLHLIQVAADFAETLERDAQAAAASLLERTRDEVKRSHQEVARERSEIDDYRSESERQRANLLTDARREAAEVKRVAEKESTQEMLTAEAQARKLLEDARHEASELVNEARAEVQQTLDWARERARQTVLEGQKAAQRFLEAAGMEPGQAADKARVMSEDS